MQIEDRKVSKVGGSSLMITLPKGWLRYMGVKRGDIVEVISNGELRIRPKAKVDTTQNELKINER